MEPQKKVEHKIVQTYAEDMAGVLENNNEGLIKKLIHEGEAQEEEKKNLSPESKKNKMFLYVSVILLVVAMGAIYFLATHQEDNSIPVEKQFVPIIFTDQSVYKEVFGLNKDEITATILNEVNATLVKKGGVEGIYLTENKQIVGLRRFLSLIKANVILSENKDLVNDNFLMGAVNNENKDFFILIKVRSNTDIFNSLRSWEEKMFSDLRGFFGITTGSEFKYLLTKGFENGIIENKNARILYNQDKKIVLMYIFADDNSIIITNSESATHETMLRLASSEKKQ